MKTRWLCLLIWNILMKWDKFIWQKATFLANVISNCVKPRDFLEKYVKASATADNLLSPYLVYIEVYVIILTATYWVIECNLSLEAMNKFKLMYIIIEKYRQHFEIKNVCFQHFSIVFQPVIDCRMHIICRYRNFNIYETQTYDLILLHNTVNSIYMKQLNLKMILSLTRREKSLKKDERFQILIRLISTYQVNFKGTYNFTIFSQ